MKLNKFIYVITKLLSFVILISIYFYFAMQPTNNNDFLVLSSNFIIIFYSWYRIFTINIAPYSLHKMFYMFSLFFFGIAPLIQYKYSIRTVLGYYFFDDTLIDSNILIILAFIFGDLVYYFTFKKIKISSPSFVKDFQLDDGIVLKLCLICMAVGVVLYECFINNFDWYSLLLRGGEDVNRISLDSSVLRKLTSIIIRPLPVFIFIYYYILGKSKPFKCLLGICVLVSCFPSSMARLAVAAYYIPILMVVFPFLQRSYNFIMTYIFSLLVVFPLFELFRNFNSNIVLSEQFFIRLTKVYTGMTYDSYQSFAFVLQNNFITYGKQLGGVLLFWMPRSLWSTKPVGSGYTMAHIYNLGWDNISMNFLGEGYINFGIVGIFMFIGVLAIFMAIFDKKYWIGYKGNIRTLFSPLFLLMFSNLTFFLRGDMMFGTAFMCGSLFSCYVIRKFICFFRKNNHRYRGI